MFVLREWTKTVLRNTEKLPPSHIYSMESQITFITIVSAWKYISKEINEVARILNIKQLMASFTQFIKAYRYCYTV